MKNVIILAGLMFAHTLYCMNTPNTDEESPLLRDASEYTQTSIVLMQDAHADTPTKTLKDLSRDQWRKRKR